MSYRNGRIPKDGLATIAGCQLLKGTAHAFAQWQAACVEEGITLTTWGKYAGYRSVATQAGMQKAYDDFHAGRAGGAAEMAKYRMDTTSKARPANAGTSRHGDALAVDIRVTKGSEARARAIGKRFGFSWPFGTDDLHHMLHDGKTAVAAAKPKPAPSKVTVRDGDTLDKIATANHTTRSALLRLNSDITDPDLIHIGQSIRVR